MIYLARHGETTWNAAGRYQGRMESHLSDLGVRQAAALGTFFGARARRGERVPVRIVSSPLKRCTATAEFAGRALGVAVETDARLLEIAHGTWDGRMRDEIAATDPARYLSWRTQPATVSFDGGESLADVDARWREFAGELPDDESDLLLCTHDAVVRVALLAIARRPLAEFWSVQAENGAFAQIESTQAGLRIVAECVRDHLGDARANPQTQAL